LTPQEIATTVVLFRKIFDWKQFTLAHEAGVHERTVQRVERGEKVDDDSLRKIAKALRLGEPGLIGPRYISAREELGAMAEGIHKDLMVTTADTFLSVKDAGSVLSAGHGYIVDDRAMPEEMSEQVAAFKDILQDWGDVYSDLSNTERLQACRSLLSELQQIEARAIGRNTVFTQRTISLGLLY
jgi:transcriptional regulator with XRE-family HTH domain